MRFGVGFASGAHNPRGSIVSTYRNKMLRVGIDYEVYSQNPDRFRELASALIDEGHEVYLVAIGLEREGEEMLGRSRGFMIPHTVISILTCDRDEDVPESILEYCVGYKINMFMGANEETCFLLRKNGIISLLEVSPA